MLHLPAEIQTYFARAQGACNGCCRKLSILEFNSVGLEKGWTLYGEASVVEVLCFDCYEMRAKGDGFTQTEIEVEPAPSVLTPDESRFLQRFLASEHPAPVPPAPHVSFLPDVPTV